MTDKNWYGGSPQPNCKNRPIKKAESKECCGSCKKFEYECMNGEGICSDSGDMVTCGDYCGDWEGGTLLREDLHPINCDDSKGLEAEEEMVDET